MSVIIFILGFPLMFSQFLVKASARNLAIILFVWDDGYWVAKGTFESACEDEEQVDWDTDGRQPTLRILQVSIL